MKIIPGVYFTLEHKKMIYSVLINNDEIPAPFMFNLWKHHLRFILMELKKINNSIDLNNLGYELLGIGNSVMDLYTGKLSSSEIIAEIRAGLIAENLFEINQYVNWIHGSREHFKKLILSDGSIWILRTGSDIHKYIHIHPGKYSPNSLRVKSTSLKTAILFNAYRKTVDIHSALIEDINFVRKKYLKEPPVKRLIHGKGLSLILDYLEERDS